MFKWLTDKRVLEYYEGRDVRFTMDTLSAHFLEEIPDGFRMIIEYKKSPIGYAQAYQLSGELFDEYDYPDDGHIVFAMDQFIGEPKYWSKQTASLILGWVRKNLEGCENPRQHGKGLAADKSGLWRYRVGDYRLLAEINDNVITILILTVGHRREVYEK